MKGHLRKRVGRNGKVSWQVVVKVIDAETGRSRQLTGTRPTRAEADALQVRLLAQAGRSAAVASSATVSQLLDAWQALHADQWSPANIAQTAMIVNTQLRPRLGQMRLAKLRTADIDMLYVDLRARGSRKGGPLARATVQRAHTALSSALAQAVRWEWIPDNPAARATVPRGDRHAINAPAPTEVVALVEAAHKVDPDWGAFLHLAAVTGARRGELCALRWNDLAATSITIARAISVGADGHPIERGTKTGNVRTIRLDTETLAVLKAHRTRARSRALEAGHRQAKDAYVFSREVEAEKPWNPSVMTKRFVRLRNELGYPNVRLHDLRHFAATQLLSGGIDLTTVAGRLGHAGGGRTTLAIYAHFLEESDQIAADLIGKKLAR